ncbi:MAG: hypothetical protein QM765_13755 [Myxococcales bacterium]
MAAPLPYRRLLRPRLSDVIGAAAVLGTLLVLASALPSAAELTRALDGAPLTQDVRAGEHQVAPLAVVGRTLPLPTASRASSQVLPLQPRAVQTWLLAPTPTRQLWLQGRRKLQVSRASPPEAGSVAHQPQAPPLATA